MTNADAYLVKSDWFVETISYPEARALVENYHYARGASKTSVYRHGLIHKTTGDICGVAWWLPPTIAVARAAYPCNNREVLALSRLVCVPTAPKNAASFLIGRSIALIKQDQRFHCLVTYADTWRGHTGAIYRATNWDDWGITDPRPVWIDPATDKLVSSKCGQRTFTVAQMQEKGYVRLGNFAKHRFRMVLPAVKRHTKGTFGQLLEVA